MTKQTKQPEIMEEIRTIYKNSVGEGLRSTHFETLGMAQIVEMIKKALQSQADKTREELTSNVNRVEVIDYTKSIEKGGGRAYVKWEDELDVRLDIQDEGKTLKVFINKLKKR